MGAVPQIIGAADLILTAIFAASYWKLIHISPAIENGIFICFIVTLFALTIVEWMIGKKTRA